MNSQFENERSYFWKPSNLRIGGQTIVPIPYWLLLLLAVAMLPIYGCADSFDGVCAAKPVGRDETGLYYMMVHCEKPDGQ